MAWTWDPQCWCVVILAWWRVGAPRHTPPVSHSHSRPREDPIKLFNKHITIKFCGNVAARPSEPDSVVEKQQRSAAKPGASKSAERQQIPDGTGTTKTTTKNTVAMFRNWILISATFARSAHIIHMSLSIWLCAGPFMNISLRRNVRSVSLGGDAATRYLILYVRVMSCFDA